MRQVCDNLPRLPESRMNTRGKAGSIPAASTTVCKKPPSGGFFSSARMAAGSEPASAGVLRCFAGHARRRKTDLRLQAQGSPIRPFKENRPSDFLLFASTKQKTALERFFFADANGRREANLCPSGPGNRPPARHGTGRHVDAKQPRRWRAGSDAYPLRRDPMRASGGHCRGFNPFEFVEKSYSRLDRIGRRGGAGMKCHRNTLISIEIFSSRHRNKRSA
jgi:hypothetical protein